MTLRKLLATAAVAGSLLYASEAVGQDSSYMLANSIGGGIEPKIYSAFPGNRSNQGIEEPHVTSLPNYRSNGEMESGGVATIIIEQRGLGREGYLFPVFFGLGVSYALGIGIALSEEEQDSQSE